MITLNLPCIQSLVIPISEGVVNLGAQQTNPPKLGKSSNHKEEGQKPSIQADFLTALQVYKAKTRYIDGAHQEARYA